MRRRKGLSKPDRSIGDTRLSPAQYADLVKSSGQPAKAMLDRFTASPKWDTLPDGLRRIIIRDVVEKSRKAAKGQMLRTRPELLQAQILERVKRKAGKR